MSASTAADRRTEQFLADVHVRKLDPAEYANYSWIAAAYHLTCEGTTHVLTASVNSGEWRIGALIYLTNPIIPGETETMYWTDVDGTHYVLPDVSWYVLGVSRPPQVFLAAAQIMFPDQTYRVAGPDQRRYSELEALVRNYAVMAPFLNRADVEASTEAEIQTAEIHRKFFEDNLVRLGIPIEGFGLVIELFKSGVKNGHALIDAVEAILAETR